MSMPEKVPSPNEISELGTVEEWRQITNQIVKRLNSLYNGLQSTADLKVGGSIYSGNLEEETSNSYILINGNEGGTDSGKIKKSNINIDDLQSLLVDRNISGLTSTGIVKITDVTDSTSCVPLTGSVQISGGVSIAKKLYVCAGVYGKFIGDGSELTNLPIESFWVNKQPHIYYGLGNVGIGDFSTSPISSNLHLIDASGCSIKIQTTDTSNTSVEFSNSNHTSKIYLSSSSLKMSSGLYDYISGDSSTGKVTLSKGLISIKGNTTEINNDVSGNYSIAMGYATAASGLQSTAMGSSTKASGNYSIAMGYTTQALGENSTSMGYFTSASGSISTAMGNQTKASGEGSIAMGNSTEAKGRHSTAMGSSTKAYGEYSTAMGHYTKANGILSTAMGSDMNVNGNYSFGISLDVPANDYELTQANTMAIMGGKVGIGKLAPGKELDVLGTIRSSDLSADRVLVSSPNRDITSSSITTTELGYLDNAKTNIQQQIDAINQLLTGINAEISVVSKWNTNSTDGTSIYRNSKVGIGDFSTTPPSEKLEVEGKVKTVAQSQEDATFWASQSSSSYSSNVILTNNVENKYDFKIQNTQGTNFEIQYATDASEWSGAYIYSPASTLHTFTGDVASTGTITAGGDIESTSDIRIKENLEIIENPIEKVKQLNGYTFNKNGEEKRSAGLIAQEVEKVLPEVVSENDDGIKSLAYGNVVALLVETVKEQQKQIDELRQMIQK